MEFSATLKTLRKTKNLSQTELANYLNVSKSTISMYELGNREPSFDLLQQISKIFNVSVDYLLGNETEIKNNDAISDIVIKLSQNEKFLNTVNLLYNASDEQLNAVESMLLAFK